MKTAIQLSLLSKYRSELMGVGAICIILCHSVGRGVLMPGYVTQIMDYCNIGVDIFLFLSGLGLYYSLLSWVKNERGGVIRWYSIRYKKLLIPYSIVIVPLFFIKCLLGLTTWSNALLDYTTLSFWTSHRSAWFVALIIPLYLIAPILYLLKQKTQKNKKVDILTCCFLCLICVVGSVVGDFEKSEGLIYNIQFALKRVPSFIIGLWIASYVRQGYSMKWVWPVLLLILSFIVKFLISYEVCPYFLMVLPLLLLLVILFETFSINSKSKKVFRFMGDISLESYLTNVALPSIIALIPFQVANINLNYGNYLFYVLVIILGLTLSVFAKRFSTRVLNKLDK